MRAHQIGWQEHDLQQHFVLTRSVVTIRRHIFIADVMQEMMEHNNPLVLPAAALNFLFGSKKYVPVQRAYGRRKQ
ncbi:hypothetical protein glysoja_025550 [Glycine soja]|uniref:Uncharacterized protein n=1 Tax=Glycine soja TaxID=3848 RepID=A0A0B2R267_GLYSO|nr:hypothetical protein glysoja_025550 [Glycine soja]